MNYTQPIRSLIMHLVLPWGGWNLNPSLGCFDSFSGKGVTALPSRETEAKNTKLLTGVWYLEKMGLKTAALVHRTRGSTPQAAFPSTPLHTNQTAPSRHPLSKRFSVSTARIQILPHLNSACWRMSCHLRS